MPDPEGQGRETRAHGEALWEERQAGVGTKAGRPAEVAKRQEFGCGSNWSGVPQRELGYSILSLVHLQQLVLVVHQGTIYQHTDSLQGSPCE